MRTSPRHSGADLTGTAFGLSRLSIFACVLAGALLASPDAHAMHLADGVLPATWCGIWFAVALPFVIAGLRRFVEPARSSAADDESLATARLNPLTAMVGAAVFAISCMPVPIPIVGSCSHPCGTGLAAILIGPWLTVLITAVALVIQALFLAHGGITTLGADVLSMGIVGGFAGFAVYRAARALGLGVASAAFFAGLFSDWATYATTALELTLGLHGSESFGKVFGALCLAFAPTQLPLGLLEAALTAGAITFLQRRRADVFARLPGIAGGPA